MLICTTTTIDEEIAPVEERFDLIVIDEACSKYRGGDVRSNPAGGIDSFIAGDHLPIAPDVAERSGGARDAYSLDATLASTLSAKTGLIGDATVPVPACTIQSCIQSDHFYDGSLVADASVHRTSSAILSGVRYHAADGPRR